MKAALVRLSLVIAVSLTAGCLQSDEAGADRLGGLKEGMTMSQALEVMGKGPLTATYSDTMRVVSGYRRMRYLINGADFQVLYSRELPGDVKEPLLQANETPVVFRNDTLLGWGWRYYVDEAIGKMQLPTPLRAIDTMTTPVTSDSAKTADSAKGPAMPAAPALVPDSTIKS